MEITVISGKGGTGKTMIAAALAYLAQTRAGEGLSLADCDVDAPNLYLYSDGENIRRESFSGGKKAVTDDTLCNRCGLCQRVCRFGAIRFGKVVDIGCEGCGACVLACPQAALCLHEEKTADIFMTKTGLGMLSRAEMDIGSEGSGKLITVLRKNAKTDDAEKLIISDGSPGIGCPVIASVTGSDRVLIVTEPTQSGLKDMQRVAELCRQFAIKPLICINKADINPGISESIERYCIKNKLAVVGKIPFDETVIRSINELKPIVVYENSPAANQVKAMWLRLEMLFTSSGSVCREHQHEGSCQT